MDMKARHYILLLAALTGCTSRPEAPARVQRVNVAEAEMAGGDTVWFSGVAQASEEVNVSFRVGGPIVRMLVREGDYVQRGQSVALMDRRDYEVQLASTRAEYDRVKADADRISAMFRERTTTAQMYDQARYSLQQITQKLDHHSHQLADTRLVAPVSGYVSQRLHEAGETVDAGMPVLTLAAGDGVEVEVNVSARDYSRLDSLTDFTCRFESLDHRILPLTLVRTARVANANQLYTLRLAVQGAYDRKSVTPGMTTMVCARVADGRGKPLVRIPSSALLRRDGHTWVFVCEAQQRVKAMAVRVDRLLSDGSALVEGIQRGDCVVSTGVRHLQDGQRVEPLPQPSATNVGNML